MLDILCRGAKSPVVASTVIAVASVLVGSSALAQQGGKPTTAGRTINCMSASLQTAINGANSGATIFFTGTCTENIEIRTDGLTLDGDPDENGVVDGTTVGRVSVNGAQRVALKNFNVDDAGPAPGGFDVGVQAFDGAAARIDNLSINVTDEFLVGVFAFRNALIRVRNSSVVTSSTGAAGPCESAAVNANINSVIVSEGGNTFENDNDAGVCASNDSYYRQNSNTNDTIEAPFPVVSFDSSLADIRGATINQNTGAGEISVGGNSMLRMRSSNLNESNITLTGLSTCRLAASTTNIGTIATPLNGVGDSSFCLAPPVP